MPRVEYDKLTDDPSLICNADMGPAEVRE